MVEDDPQGRMEMYVRPPYLNEYVKSLDPAMSLLDFILAACDVEGNFLVVKAYQYTTLLSCMLLDAWAIPVCLLFSWLYIRPKYHWTQLLVRLSFTSSLPSPLPPSKRSITLVRRASSFALVALACSLPRMRSRTRTGPHSAAPRATSLCSSARRSTDSVRPTSPSPSLSHDLSPVP